MTERPGLTSGEGIGEPSFISWIRDLLHDHRAEYAQMGSKPDYASVIDAPEIKAALQKLTNSEREALREMVRKEFGFDIDDGVSASAVAERPKTPEDETVATLRGQLQTIRELYAQDSIPLERNKNYLADLENFWTSDAFTALSPEQQRDLRTEFGAGAGGERSRAATPKPEIPAAHERKERRQQPLTYVFKGYRLSKNEGAWTVEEDTDVWDDDKKQYVKKDPETSIAIPDAAIAALRRDPAVERKITEVCTDLRRNLDARGVKLFFDFDKDKAPRDVSAVKWKTWPEGKLVVEYLKVDEVPPAVLEAVRAGKVVKKERTPDGETVEREIPYHKTDAYNTWFGPLLQAKREEIISGQLAEWATREFPAVEEASPTAAAVKDRETAPIAVETRREAVAVAEDQESLRAEKELSAFAARQYVDEGIEWALKAYPEPTKDLGTFFDRIANKVSSTLQEYYNKRKVPKDAQLTEKEIAEPVAEVVRARYSGQPELAAALDPWLENKTDRIVSHIELSETPGREYGMLRSELAAVLETGGDLSRFKDRLKRHGAGADDALKKAVQQLIIDIEHGAAGPATEGDLSGLDRSASELEFLKTRPALNARNIEIVDWREAERPKIIVHLDRLDPDGSARRALSRFVADASPDLAPDLAAKVTEYVYGLLAERNGNRPLSIAFQADVAHVDRESREIVLTDLPRLKGVIKRAGLYKAMEQRKDGTGSNKK